LARPQIRLAMMEPPHIEDPFDWSVNQVVTALCNARASWTHSRAASPLPELKRFEQALRDNEINGCILLTQVDHTSLREDLGLKVLGHRGTVMLAVHKLRGQSQKWKEHIQEVASQTPLPGSGIMMSSDFGSRSGFGSPFYGSPAFAPPPAAPIENGYHQSPAVSPQRAREPERNVALTEEPPPAKSYPGHDTLGEGFSNIPELPRADERQPLEYSPIDAIRSPPGDPEVEQQSLMESSSTQEGCTFDNGVNEDSALHTGSVTQPVVWESNHRPGETYIIDDSGRKRRRLALIPIESEISSHLDVNDDNGSHQQSGQNMEPGVTASHALHSNIEEKLIGEEGVTSLIEKNSLVDVDSVAEPWVERGTEINTVPGVDYSGVVATESPEAGKLVIDANGRKRMRPVLVSQPGDEATAKLASTPDVTSIPAERAAKFIQEGEDLDNHSKIRDSGKKSRHAYLGPKSFPVDEVFYGSSAVGEEVKIDVRYEIPAEFVQPSQSETYLVSSASQPANGQRLYVHELMKRFLSQSERKVFRRNGQVFTAVIPYSERIGRKHQSQSFTLCSRSPSAITATREDLSKWPAARTLTDAKEKSQTDLDSAFTRFNVPDEDPFSLRENANENHDWDFLEKWRYVDQDDKVLPVYGESGSEVEYDLDTWRETEEERGTLERTVGKSKRKRLTDEEVMTAMDQGLEELEAKWRMKRLPLGEHKAWRIWTKSRRDRSQHQQIELATARICYLNNVRLSKMRKEMTNEIWSNMIQVKKQCKIMEETVFEREDQKWRVSVLQSKSPPSKPPPRDTVRPTKAPRTHESLGDDEEILESSNDPVESSDDDLDGFIIEDDVHEELPGAEAEMLLDTERVLDADDEHVLDIDNNDIDSEDEVVPPTVRGQLGLRGMSLYPNH